MKPMKQTKLSRRTMLTGAGGPRGNHSTQRARAQDLAQDLTQDLAQDLATPAVQRNLSGFASHQWQDHFETRKNGVILCDTVARYVNYWSEDGTIHKVYPSSVPLSEELTRLGRTEVTQKVDGPSWRPTPSMKERNPEWPDYWPPGPDNPLGTHALYLSWTYYRVHGTGDSRKIGRKSSNGCIGLYNEHIAELFALAKVGTQVVLI